MPVPPAPATTVHPASPRWANKISTANVSQVSNQIIPVQCSWLDVEQTFLKSDNMSFIAYPCTTQVLRDSFVATTSTTVLMLCVPMGRCATIWSTAMNAGVLRASLATTVQWM